ncbi:MAG: hypothetical protein KC620_07100, partial [Myxococcales bacterium]|nr:hypothetical protein [Myxococcales bacterium]
FATLASAQEQPEAPAVPTEAPAVHAEAPATPPEPPARLIPAPPEGANYVATPADPPDAEAAAEEDNSFEVFVSGYVRARYQAVLEDPDQTDFTGRNDGFSLDNARLIVEATRGDLTGYISIDGAVDRRDRGNTATGRVDVGLKDAYVGYAPLDFVAVKVGQFKPPFDAEEQRSTRSMLFIDRAVESRGVKGVEGYNLDGLSLDREVGLIVYGEPALLGDLGIGYYLSITNGTGANRPVNDNDRLAYTGRLEVRYGEMVQLGFGANLNQATSGENPDLIDEDFLSYAGDLNVNLDLGIVGVMLQAQFMQRSTSFPDVPAEPEQVARGYHFALGVALPLDLTVAYRYAWLDPTVDFEAEDAALESTLDNDAVTHHTIGLTYEPEAVPVKLQFNYTLAVEEEARAIDNDRVDALVQVAF